MPFLMTILTGALGAIRSKLMMIGLGAAALLTVSATGYALIQRSNAHDAQAARAAAVLALGQSEAARKAEEENHRLSVAALESRAAAAEARAANTNTIREEVRRAPSTTACSTSPAVRKLLDGVRQSQPQPAQRGAAPAARPGKPAGVPR